MRKLRYIAPGVIAAAAAATVVGQAAPALAATHKNDTCTENLCLYFSAGAGSGIFQTNSTRINNLEFFDFTNGAGAGTIVRNNAHSFNDVPSYQIWSKPSLKGVERTIPGVTPPGINSASPLPAAEINNESSFLQL